MNALLITLGIYAIPVFFNGLAWYAQATLSSLLYIILIYHFSHSRERFLLIFVEFLSLSLISFSFVSKYYLEQQNFVRANITDIMDLAFLAELIICIGGMALGVSKRSTILRRRHTDSDKSDNRINLFWEIRT